MVSSYNTHILMIANTTGHGALSLQALMITEDDSVAPGRSCESPLIRSLRASPRFCMNDLIVPTI